MFSKRYVATSVLVLVGLCNYLTAQWENGYRPLYEHAARLGHSWADSSTLRHHIAVPILRKIPPLNESFPEDVRLSYIVIDSVLRFSHLKPTRSAINEFGLRSDTMKAIFKYAYRVVDYDPVTFCQYANATSNLRKKDSAHPAWRHLFDTTVFRYPDSTHQSRRSRSKYNFSLTGLRSDINRKILQNTKERTSLSRRLANMLAADYILRVEVVEVDSVRDRRYGIDTIKLDTTWDYSVLCRVKEVFKGRRWPVPQLGGQEFGASGLTGGDTLLPIRFSYLKSNSNVYFFEDGSSYDSVLVDPNTNYRIPEGIEGIVGLIIGENLIDNYNDHLDVILDPGFGNFLRIANGVVHDPLKHWGNTETYTLPEFRTIIDSLRNMIETGVY